MSNTSKRIRSAALLIFLIITTINLGQLATFILLFIAGMLIIDEIEANFFKHPRKMTYWFSQILFTVLLFLLLLKLTTPLYFIFWIAAIVLDFSLLYYLFFVDVETKAFALMKRIPFLSAIYVFFSFVCLGLLIKDSQWVNLLTLAILIASGTDTAAWFVGRHFGKTQLCPIISPKKTREGLYGGMATAGVVATLFYTYRFHIFSPSLIIIFAFLGLISHLGDLVKAKFKRQANIKDSSSLIPGHGGVFDRLDSIIFLAPFFLIWRHLWLH